MKDIINIARVCGTHHLKGVVKAFSLFDEIELIQGKKVVAESDQGDRKLLTIESVSRMTDDKITIKFEEINHIDDARKIMSYKIMVRRDILGELTNDDFFLFDLLDMEVYTVEGERLGTVSNIMNSAAHDIYIVTDGEKEIMIPAVENFVKDIDFEKERITVKLIEGMR